MSVSGVIVVILFLALLGGAPILVIGLLTNRRQSPMQSSSQRCRKCGALNPLGREHCYDCGVSLPPLPPLPTKVTLIQRVKEAVDRKSGRRIEAHSPAKIVSG